MSSGKFTRDMITPEIAAVVVKEYLLPMFENDGKRLHKSNRKLVARGGSVQLSTPGCMPDQSNIDQKSPDTIQSNKTVYGELKLS